MTLRRSSLSAESQQRVANAKAHMIQTVIRAENEALKQYVAILEQELQYNQVSHLSRCADCIQSIEGRTTALDAKASDSAGSGALLIGASAQSKQQKLG